MHGDEAAAGRGKGSAGGSEKGAAAPPAGDAIAAGGVSVVIEVDGLEAIIAGLRGRGYTVIGPTRRDGAITLAEIAGVADLPRGCADTQEAGAYRVRGTGGEALFGFASTPQSWKAVLFPARELLWSASVDRTGFAAATVPPEGPPYALLGVRSCDLHAIYIQDRVLLGRTHTDPAYAARRESAFLIAVGCSEPSGTCFCVSMGTGPKPESGFDLALTEVLDASGHRFVVRPGSVRGADVLRDLAPPAAGPDDLAAADRVTAAAATRMGRHLDTDGIRDLLYTNPDHPRWDDVASRCLSCTNCTLVCPTCFCVSVENVTDLTGANVTRNRVWDSCFTSGHSHLPNGSVRRTTRSRYRQWLTHKLASWIDQFGTSGCVGCGRCITWCPAAIDITEEAAALRAPAPAGPGPAGRPHGGRPHGGRGSP